MMRLLIECKSGAFCGVRRSVEQFLRPLHWPEEITSLIILAVDEACANVLEHAYGGECRQSIRLRFDHYRGGIRIVIRDYGKSCCPESIRGRSLAEVRPGGLGLHFIHHAFDEVLYEPQKRGTRLTLIRHAPKQAAKPVTNKNQARLPAVSG